MHSYTLTHHTCNLSYAWARTNAQSFSPSHPLYCIHYCTITLTHTSRIFTLLHCYKLTLSHSHTPEHTHTLSHTQNVKSIPHSYIPTLIPLHCHNLLVLRYCHTLLALSHFNTSHCLGLCKLEFLHCHTLLVLSHLCILTPLHSHTFTLLYSHNLALLHSHTLANLAILPLTL